MKKAFTLIELLVVIAIIAILAAMLMPALERARSAARKASCRQNIHNAGLAVSLFKDDHGDQYDVSDCVFYDYAACQTMAFIMNDGYLKDWDVLVCPELDTPGRREPMLYNQGVSWSRCNWPKSGVGNIGNTQPWWGPEEFCYFLDEFRIPSDAVPDRVIMADGIAMCTEYGPEPANHDDGANMLFADLAVQWGTKSNPDQRWTKNLPEFYPNRTNPQQMGEVNGIWVRYGYFPNPRRDEDNAIDTDGKPVYDMDDVYEIEGLIKPHTKNYTVPNPDPRGSQTPDEFCGWTPGDRCETMQNGGMPSKTDAAVAGGMLYSGAFGDDYDVDVDGYAWRGGSEGEGGGATGPISPFYSGEGAGYAGWHWGVPEEFESRVYD